MLPLHSLATALQADRERGIRERLERLARLEGLPRGRHPHAGELGSVDQPRIPNDRVGGSAPGFDRRRVARGERA